MRWIATLIVVLFCGCLAHGAATYYVNEDTGDDVTGDGTSGTPWASIEKAVQTCDGATPITIYVKLPADGTFNEADMVSTDASCQDKDVTIEGYTTTAGDGTAGCVPVVVAVGGQDGFTVGHTAGTLTFKYLDLSITGADTAGDAIYQPTAGDQVSVTFDSCTLQRSVSQSGAGASLIYLGGPAVPTRDLTFTNCTITDYTAGAHTSGLIQFSEFDDVTMQNCTVSGSPAGGIGYAMSCSGTIDTLTITNTTSTITHNSSSGFFVLFQAAIENVSEIKITGSTFADSLIKFDDSDEGPGRVLIANNTITASGDGIYFGISVGDPTAPYGPVYVINNTISSTSESTADHPVGLLRGVSSGEVAYNTMSAATGVEYEIVAKADNLVIHHNVVSCQQIAVYLVVGTHFVTNNTLVQTADTNTALLKFAYNGAAPTEDKWPEHCVVTDNIIDAGSGSECILMIDDSGVWNPPLGSYQTRLDRNIYVIGADGIATIWGTDCANLAALQAAWTTHAGSGTPTTNDANSSAETSIGYWDASSNDYRLYRNSPAFTDDPNYFNATIGAWNKSSGGNSRWWQHRRLGL